MQEQNLHPLEDPAAPGHSEPGSADVSLDLVSVWDDNLRHLINSYTYTSRSLSTPVLLKIRNGKVDASQLQPNGFVCTLPAKNTIEPAARLVSAYGGSLVPPPRLSFSS